MANSSSARGQTRAVGATISLLAFLAAGVVVLIISIVYGAHGSDENSIAAESTSETSGSTENAETSSAAPLMRTAEPTVDLEAVENEIEPGTFQATFYSIEEEKFSGSENQKAQWPALSLSKLFIAYYVLENGTDDEGYFALDMVADSSDVYADQLNSRYPQAINEVAEEFDLESTASNGYWGQSTTSSYDVVSFLAQLHSKSPFHPLLVAMSMAPEVAADGYAQDYGTHILPGALASKWGWSNDRTVNASVTLGDGWIAAAFAYAPPEQLSALADEEFAAAALAAGSS